MSNTANNVRLIDKVEVLPGQIFRAYAGESTDAKPGDTDDVTQRTGNVFLEIDTGDVYFYNERTESWAKPGASGGDE